MADRANVLIVEDDPAGRRNLARLLRKTGYSVNTTATAEEARRKLSAARYDLVMADLVLEGGGSGLDVLDAAKSACTDTEVIIITGYASVETAVSATRKGAYHYIQKPFHAGEVRLLASRAIEKSRLCRQVKELEYEVRSPDSGPGIVGGSQQIQAILRLIEQVAPTDANVLITGESGTGKELVASSIHHKSHRAGKKFLAINCASFTDELLANELFGHEKEAYTGATSARAGLLESADGGTVFFDEVADMPQPMQAKLLRVIQERELIRVGGTRPVPLDLRIIAATNRDLKKAVTKGAFREDLYYRLNVIPIHVPPLSERKEDIPLLAAYLIRRIASDMGRDISGFSDDAISMLTHYDYPGNVRELENILERAAALCSGDVIRESELPGDLKDVSIYRFDRETGHIKSMDELERDYIQWVMKKTGNNKTQAAKLLGIDRASLYRKLNKYQLEK